MDTRMIMKNKNRKIASIIVETWSIIYWKLNGNSEMLAETFEKRNKEFRLMENTFHNYFGIN